VGFLLLLIIGVAFWMFPRIRGQRPGREWGWVAFALINAGLLLRLLAQPLATGPDPPSAWRAVLIIAAILPVLGVAAFAASILPRLRGALSPDEARRLRAENEVRTGGRAGST
jgi:hypothetical protein